MIIKIMNQKRHVSNLFFAAVSVGLLLLVTACSPAGAGESEAGEPSSQVSEGMSDARADGTLRVVTTTTQAGDLIEVLTEGTSNISFTKLMGAGVDPHLYQPTESDIAAMNEAEMVIYSGLHLEGQFDTVFEALSGRGVVIHSMGNSVRDAGFVIASSDDGSSDDPHFWFDPRNWEITVLDTAEVLADLVPTEASRIRENAQSYISRLEALFSWAEEGMGSVPEGQRYLVTSHDAFQYFGAAFGWRMEAIQGISTEDEAGVGDIQGTVDFVLDNQIPVLFVESSIPPDTIEAVIEAIAAQGGEVRIGVRELFADAMGEPGTFGGTYLGMITHNVMTILQSYRSAGAEVVIPEWPGDIGVDLPQEYAN